VGGGKWGERGRKLTVGMWGERRGGGTTIKKNHVLCLVSTCPCHPECENFGPLPM